MKEAHDEWMEMGGDAYADMLADRATDDAFEEANEPEDRDEAEAEWAGFEVQFPNDQEAEKAYHDFMERNGF